MKYTLLYLFLFLLTSCVAQTLPIVYNTEEPTPRQIDYTENETDKTKHYIIFRHSFESEMVKVYVDKELIAEGELKPVDPSFGIEYIAIIDRKTRNIKVVFDNATYYLSLKKEYQYVFMDNYDGKIEVLFSKYIKFDF